MNIKINSRVKTLILSIVALSILGLIFLPTQQTQKANVSVSNASVSSVSASKESYINRVREGLGEAELTSGSLSPGLKVNSMANLMELRSGVGISPLVREKLARMETVVFSGKDALVSFDKVVDTLTDTTLEQVSKLTDDEIVVLIKTARGFSDSSNSVDSNASNVRNQPIGVFPGYYIDVSDREAFRQIKACTNPSAQIIIKAQIRSKIREQVGKTLSDFALAAPSAFGGNWDINAKEPAKGLTPSQAMLITYAIVSGDGFADTTTGLSTAMEKKHQALAKRYVSYPSPSGHSAYGANGYLFSSAFALFFNEENQLELLNKFSAK